MSDTLIRIMVVAAIVVLAALVAWLIGRVRRPPHPDVAVPSGIGERPGVILFTSTTCSTCHDAIAMLEGERVRFREVTTELESRTFAEADVIAVPLTVVVDGSGSVVRTFSGVPPRRGLRRAMTAAGVIRS